MQKSKKLSIGYKWVLNNMPFILFIAALFICNIAFVHLGEKKIRAINTLGKQNKQLLYQYKTLNGNLLFQSKKSELEKAVVPMKLKLPTELPILISDSTTVIK